MKRTLIILFFALLLSARAVGQATILWNEGVNGVLSNDPGIPTALGTLQTGTNSVLGATEFIPNGIYGDYFTFTVPNALGIPQLWLSSYNPVAVWLGSPDFGSQLGGVLNPANADLLPQWEIGPIAAGTYGMYIANYDIYSGGSVANYRLDFVVTAVPEPSAVGLMLAGGAMVITLRKTRGRI